MKRNWVKAYRQAVELFERMRFDEGGVVWIAIQAVAVVLDIRIVYAVKIALTPAALWYIVTAGVSVTCVGVYHTCIELVVESKLIGSIDCVPEPVQLLLRDDTLNGFDDVGMRCSEIFDKTLCTAVGEALLFCLPSVFGLCIDTHYLADGERFAVHLLVVEVLPLEPESK